MQRNMLFDADSVSFPRRRESRGAPQGLCTGVDSRLRGNDGGRGVTDEETVPLAEAALTRLCRVR